MLTAAVGQVLPTYDGDHLAQLSPDRRIACLKVLLDLKGWVAPTPLERAEHEAIAAFLTERIEAGYSAATVYKYRAIIASFFAWAWREGYIGGDTLLELRAIVPPNGGGGRDQPHPYRPGELRELRRTLDRRWPRLQMRRPGAGRAAVAPIRRRGSRAIANARCARATRDLLARPDRIAMLAPGRSIGARQRHTAFHDQLTAIGPSPFDAAAQG